LLLVACITCGAIATASADDADDAADAALALARQGETAAAGGDFTGAVSLFKQALAKDPRPEYQCNVGVAYYKGGDLPRAQLFLSLCLTRGSHLDATFLGAVRDVLVSVEDTLRAGEFSPIDVVVTPASAEITVSAFEADEVVVGSRLLWLPVGEHTITVAATGFDTETVTVTAQGHDPVRVPVTLAKSVVAVPDPIEREQPTSRLETDHRGGWRRAAWIGTGVTGVVALLTVAQYVKAWGATTDAGEQPPGLDYTIAAREAQRQIDRLYIAYGVTALCAAVTAGLWWQSRPRERMVLGAAPTSDGGGAVWLSGAF